MATPALIESTPTEISLLKFLSSTDCRCQLRQSFDAVTFIVGLSIPFAIINMASPAPIVDLETNPIPHQAKFSVLNLQGVVLKGDFPEKDALILFQMLADVGALSLQKFRRLSVSFGSSRYVVTRDSHHIYAVLVVSEA